MSNKRGYCHLYYLFYLLFLFYANPVPSSIPPPLNPHNRQVDDCVAGKEELLIEGVEVEVEAEEVTEYVGVGKNKENCPITLILFILLSVDLVS